MCVALVIVEVLVVLVVVIQQGSAHWSLQLSITATDEQVKPATAKLSQVAWLLHGELHKLLGHPSGGSTATTRPISSHTARGTIKRPTAPRLDGSMAHAFSSLHIVGSLTSKLPSIRYHLLIFVGAHERSHAQMSTCHKSMLGKFTRRRPRRLHREAAPLRRRCFLAGGAMTSMMSRSSAGLRSTRRL